MDLHFLTIVCLCQVIFSAISIVEELHFSIILLSLFKMTMWLQLQNADFHKMIYTRPVPVQRAVELDEIPYPYKVHDTTLRPLLNITIKSTIVVRNHSRSCGGGDICGTTPA